MTDKANNLFDDDKEVGVTQKEIDAAWIIEIERRLANLDERKLIPLDEAMRMAKARLIPTELLDRKRNP